VAPAQRPVAHPVRPGKAPEAIQATITSSTSHIAVELASDKEETNRLLGDLGLPVPRQRLVRSEKEAIRAAEKLGSRSSSSRSTPTTGAA